MVSAPMPMNTAGFGCTTARFSIHGSRGRTQQMRVGVHTVAEQPDARVGGGLAGADDHELRRRSAEVDQLVDRYDVRPVGHSERAAGVVAGINGER